MNNNLFYSEAEKIAFLVPNYYIDSNSNLQEFTANLFKHRDELLTACNFHPTVGNYHLVKTHYIESSSRYKHMRAFAIENVLKTPEGAFVITDENEWTMWKWLHN